MDFAWKRVPARPDGRAPDGSEVRLLFGGARGGLAHFVLPPRTVSKAVTHRTVEEVWYFVAGHGEMWRRRGDREERLEVGPEIALTVPLGTHFQLRNPDPAPLVFVIATMPPWPGADEAIFVAGLWPPGPLDASA